MLGGIGIFAEQNGAAVSYAALHPVQISSGHPSHLFLLPLTPSALRLNTYTQDVTVRTEGEQLILAVRATYRLHNSGREDLAAPLQVAPPQTGGANALPEGATLTVDGQVQALQPGATAGQQTTVINFTPDSYRTVTLNYQMRQPSSTLVTMLVPLSTLTAWPGAPASWRFTLTLPGEQSGILPAESWTATQPEGWTYDGTKVQWLDEGAPPDEIVWQAIHPTLWRSLQEVQQSLTAQSTPDLSLRLGDLYTQLYRAAEAGFQSRDRFYAQALAAYHEGLSSAEANGNPQATAPLHQAMTALYRSRSVEADGSVEMRYVDLLVEEAKAALAAFPPEDERRREVAQWLAEGLRLQLQRAQERSDWQTASARLDELATLPADLIDSAWLAAERELVQLQQALALLNQNNQEAAIALAGPTVADETLLPRPEARALLASWQVTVTIQPAQLRLQAVAKPLPGREDYTRQAVEQLQRAWQDTGITGAHVAITAQQSVEVQFDDLSQAERVTLAQAIPPVTDWAILRSLLMMLDPHVEERARLLWEDVTISQLFDLRDVVDQWRGTAALLERAATTESGENLATADLSAVQNQVRGQLFALYHQQEAQHWQNLVRSSHVRVAMESPSTAPLQRTWLLPIEDAAQTLVYHAETINPLRLGLLALALFIFVLVLTAIFWLLL